MFSAEMTIAGFDPDLAQAIGGRAHAPGRSHRADRLRELRQPARARGAGLGADQQVRRRLSGQALLRRLRVRGHRRAAGHRSRQEAVRRRLRQRAAALRLAGQRGRVPGADRSGRHHPRHEPGPRRPPHARREGEFLGQAVHAVQYGVKPRHRRHRLRPGRAARAGTQAEADHRRILRLFARDRLGALPPDRRPGRRLFLRRHGARRGPGRDRALSEPGAVRRRGDDAPRTRRCAGRAAA